MNAPNKMNTTCMHCACKIRFNSSMLGKSAKCPGCSQIIELNEYTANVKIQTTTTGETQQDIQSPSNDTLRKNSKVDQIAFASASTSKSDTTKFDSTRYELLRCIGKGGFGEVWEALDRHLGRNVAIKLPRFLPNERKKIERFVREGRAAAQLRHPNIVSVFDAGDIDGQHYLAIEFVSGSPLSELGSNRSLSQEHAAKMIADLARALNYAHSQKIIHRDIKPHNIVVNAQGQPQILDFGLAKSLADETGLTMDGTVMGTPAYMSPEQAMGDLKSVGPASDQYSLGATLYWLLTGQALFSGPPAAVIAQVVSVEPQPPKMYTPELDDRLDAICLKAISKIPSHRYDSCLELAKDLDRYLNDEIVSARPIGPLGKAYRWAGKNRFDAALMALATVVLAIAVATSSVGYWRSNLLLTNASQLQTSVKKTLEEIESTKKELQTQADALTQAKSRSVQAKRQLAESQQAAEKSQTELKAVIDENARLQIASKKQLAIIEENNSRSHSLNMITQAANSQVDRVVNRPMHALTRNDRKSTKDRIYNEAFAAMERKDYQAAEKLLAQIPEQFRDYRYRLQSSVVKNQGSVQIVKKSLSDILSQAELSRLEQKLCLIDATSGTLQIQIISDRKTGNQLNRYVFVDLLTGARIATTNQWIGDSDHWNGDWRTTGDRLGFAILNEQRTRFFEFRTDYKYGARQPSSDWRSFFSEFTETTNANRRYSSIPGRIEAVTLSSGGEVCALIERKFENAKDFGKKQVGGTLQIATFSPDPDIHWSISNESLFKAALLPEFSNSDFTQFEHYGKLKFFLSSSHASHLPFEYYDSRLQHNLFGIFSIRDMKLVRLAAVTRKDDRERSFKTVRATPEPLLWSEHDVKKFVELKDHEFSNVELPPRMGINFAVNLGESWGDISINANVIKTSSTPIFRLPEPPQGTIKQTVWSTTGETVAFITEKELWIVNLCKAPTDKPD